MGRFDEFLDEFLFMAKSAADAAGKKTGEVVEASKLKYQVKQTEWDLEKVYAKLGAIVYESKRSDEDFSESISLALGEIDELKLKLGNIEDTLKTYRKTKKCVKCDQDNDSDSAYCARCGSPLNDGPIPAGAPVENDASGDDFVGQ